MIYGSVCSGIEAATVAWHPLGWVPAWFSEIETFPCSVLKHHYPHVPNLGNMLLLHENQTFINDTIDILVGGTPCQSFSVAGLREGLACENGNLALEFCRILVTKRPRWFVWENVPGALSSFSDASGQSDEETSDFAAILSAFHECGYSCAWRVLDAQHFGVPQRRRRIFVVGYFGNDWRPPAAVLFDGESVSGNIAKGRKKAKEVTGTLDARTKGGGFPGSDGTMNGHVVPTITQKVYGDNKGTEDQLIPVVGALTSMSKGRQPGINEAAAGQVLAFQSSQSGIRLSNTHATLDANNGSRRHNGVLLPCWWDGGQVSQTLDRVLSKGQTMPEKNRFPAVLCYPYNQIGNEHCRSNPQPGDPSPTLSKSNTIMVVPAVRRLTPLECERLQGFPDNYTLVLGCSDTSRYQSIGNSMAVPVMHWIGKRIDIVDKFLNK
jgi:DNA (cytosine-5)-methyltransferase 1